MKALVVVVAVLFALWLVGRMGAREAAEGGSARPVDVSEAAAPTAAVSAEPGSPQPR